MGTTTSGKAVRMQRLFSRGDGRLIIMPIDHTVSEGPIADSVAVTGLVNMASDVGIDAVVLHKGRLRSSEVDCWRRLSLIVHLSASTKRAGDPNAKVLVTSVEEALRRGADAVSVHVNLGSQTESQQIADLGSVADTADRWGVPLLAMMYARGPSIRDPADAELVAHAASLAAELGADLVKTVYTGDVDSMRDVVNSCPIGVLAAGGPRYRQPEEVESFVQDVLAAGVIGVAIGRNIFEAEAPVEIAEHAVGLVHPAVTVMTEPVDLRGYERGRAHQRVGAE